MYLTAFQDSLMNPF
ncbi:hypothetical protein MAR_027694 [Mya arenaria]|uniref:Uncharacterized protein n=1 Tax=Mya arenaria TaxID=6604 RepID=A0ABY7EWL9_MYAAR|nr:hypothetical protein MAR_027694 [Mya arenaria]